MLLSQYFLPLLKEKPQDAQITSHALMIKAGMIRQQASGIYSWLPLGLQVLKNIEKIICTNMELVGVIELLMPCLQPADLWIETGRFDNYGKEMLKFADRHEKQLLFSPTNEDMITDIFRKNIKSYKQLPKTLYQIQWKFRDEIRPRFGVMRGREFLMKDAYSFDIDEISAVETYNKMFIAYMRTFKDMGLSAIPVVADNGPIGGKLSHEFHIIAETGESTIYYDKAFRTLKETVASDIKYLKTLYAAAEEKHDAAKCPVPSNELLVSKSIEVGHIFYIGTKYSEAMGAVVNDKDGKLTPVEMSSYGIGISRLVGAIIESSNDEKGIIWPDKIAPFKVSIINLNINDETCNKIAMRMYDHFRAQHLNVIVDDTDERAGSKFATHDLIGSPWQIIIGTKKAAHNIVELKHRKTGESDDLTVDIAIKQLLGNLNVK